MSNQRDRWPKYTVLLPRHSIGTTDDAVWISMGLRRPDSPYQEWIVRSTTGAQRILSADEMDSWWTVVSAEHVRLPIGAFVWQDDAQPDAPWRVVEHGDEPGVVKVVPTNGGVGSEGWWVEIGNGWTPLERHASTPETPESFHAIRRADGDLIGDFGWLSVDGPDDWPDWLEDDGPTEYEIARHEVTVVARKVLPTCSECDEPGDYWGLCEEHAREDDPSSFDVPKLSIVTDQESGGQP